LMISACQFGITLASLGLGALAEPVVASLLTKPLAALHIPHELVHPLALGIALTLVWLLVSASMSAPPAYPSTYSMGET